jgi:aminoglycoside 6'-N-acetyltransferase
VTHHEEVVALTLLAPTQPLRTAVAAALADPVTRPRVTPGGERVRLRPATVDDLPWFRELLAEPAVAAWWDGDSLREVEALLADDGDPDTVVFTAEFEGRPAGLLFASEEPEPGYRHASIDVTLTSALHGRGLGRDAVATLAAWLVDARGHHRVTIDPSADNARAIACYRAVGFREVGVMRAYERRGDGTWRDGLLMDLLAEELVRPA